MPAAAQEAPRTSESSEQCLTEVVQAQEEHVLDRSRPLTIFCVATYFKGADFLRTCKARGCRVLLLTAEKLRDAAWPRDSVDSFFYLPGQGEEWNYDDLMKGVSYVARTEHIDKVVALDDFDLEKAAAIREHLRVPGLGDTRTRFFRDKLAMRIQAEQAGIEVPAFLHLLNHERIQAFADTVPPPWVVKPRSQASALGIKKVGSREALWPVVDELGDEHSFYLLERFVPGDIYHVDSVVFEGEVVFACASRYLRPPFEVMHEGGLFATQTIPYGSADDEALQDINRRVLQAMGLESGVSHTEFIKAHADGRFCFLETSARVGGAHIAEMVEAASGVNLWSEWARIETQLPGEAYHVYEARQDHAGLLITLARQEHPDLSAYTDPEIVWRMNEERHAGLIVKSDRFERVQELLESYTRRFYTDFHTSVPPPARATN